MHLEESNDQPTIPRQNWVRFQVNGANVQLVAPNLPLSDQKQSILNPLRSSINFWKGILWIERFPSSLSELDKLSDHWKNYMTIKEEVNTTPTVFCVVMIE